MPSVTKYYGITASVDFVDVEVDQDNKLFVDPFLVRHSPGPMPFLHRAHKQLDSFLDTLTGCVLSSNSADRAHGRLMLQSFNEPRETRLGMSRAGFNGHGGAAATGDRIWDMLACDCRVLIDIGVLQRVEHLALYIEGIDRDIVSDLTTRIIFDVQVEFTESQMTKHPGLARDLITIERPVWDAAASDWVTRTFTLPVVHGEPLLLVPKLWAGPGLQLNAGRFHGTTLLTHVQDERAVTLPSGKIHRIPKRLLRVEPGLRRGRTTNIEVTARSFEEGINLITLFEDFVHGRRNAA